MPKFGIVAGSGFYDFGGVAVTRVKKIETPYGAPSDEYKVCESEGVSFVFLPRHGALHRIAPHMINYRANMWGFKEMGVERIISINAVGGISRGIKPGELVVPDQIIDKTHGRKATFYDRDEIIHIDFTMPYCGEMREAILQAGEKTGTGLKATGTYICVNGPRLESKAEIDNFSAMGADIIGMTAMPEACLARELELCYAIIAVVTNYAAGISERRLTVTEVVDMMKVSEGQIRTLVMETLKIIPEKRACGCREALREARL
ncbi:MAG TPA: S-methyl-5'-thioadenosine phosphorylase [Thermodesulfovibrionales bacterium]|nr:S-methyl-5'-thioadenosine phosphorylase [Thermodesulfovibrionales bacterium]